MTICDLCKKNVPTRVCAFGSIESAVTAVLPTWDLCNGCEKKISIKINSFINEARLDLDDKDYLFNKKYGEV